jgi:hypothetical protein
VLPRTEWEPTLKLMPLDNGHGRLVMSRPSFFGSHMENQRLDGGLVV